MKYTGQFRSIQKDKLYTLNIYTDGSAGTTRITLGANPFTVEVNGSQGTIYTPVKASSATAQIISNPMYFDLYSASAKQNKVELLDSSNNVEWIGYTTPNTYNTPYSHDIETYEVECLDALGILKYFDYTTVGESKSFRSFSEIIWHILDTSEIITNWYFSNSCWISDASGNRITDQIYISEQNFFDEDEKPMKMNEVLEEICKYCGVTAICDKTSVYFIDYDGLSNIYSRYSGGDYIGTINLYNSYTIDSSSYRNSNTTLSMENTYSRVRVKDSLYSLDSVVPDLFNDEDLRNIKGYPWTSDGDHWNDGNSGKTSNKYIEGADAGKKRWENNSVFFEFYSKFYENKKFNHYYYNLNGTAINPDYTAETSVYSTQTHRKTNYVVADYKIPTMINNTQGALFCKMDVSSWSAELIEDIKGEIDKKPHNQYEYDNYLLLHLNLPTQHYMTGKLLEVNKDNYNKPFFISNKAKILITGSIQFDDREGCPIPLSGGYHEELDKFNFSDLYLNTQLKCNNYYWNGISWSRRVSTFNLPYYDDSDASQTRGDHFCGKEFKVKDTTTLADMAEESGYLINLPNYNSEEQAIPNVPEFSFYGRGNVDRDYRLDRIWMKDFNIVYYMPYEGSKDENDTDTEYEFTINDEYVNDLGDIEFKICTWDGKQVNYSATAYMKNSEYKFVNHINHPSLGLTDKRSEELMCYRIVNQYSQPAKKLELTLVDDIQPWYNVSESTTNGTYIVDKITKNYVYDSRSYTLIEKF